MYKLFFIILVFRFNVLFAQSSSSLFEKANKEFVNGNYTGTINYQNADLFIQSKIKK